MQEQTTVPEQDPCWKQGAELPRLFEGQLCEAETRKGYLVKIYGKIEGVAEFEKERDYGSY